MLGLTSTDEDDEEWEYCTLFREQGRRNINVVSRAIKESRERNESPEGAIHFFSNKGSHFLPTLVTTDSHELMEALAAEGSAMQ